MREPGKYDSNLQMFVEEVKLPKLNHLRFYRKLAEEGKLEHLPVSIPRGDMRIIEVFEEVRRKR